ncbi:c-type cytochrome [Granulosicoccaceae sp. 1_MG-2023]|nr:c-type cytochrome [Granulosicoccaceae sp. 1_MG-2023]
MKTTWYAMLLALVAAPLQAQDVKVPVNLPPMPEGKYVHEAPTLEDLEADESINPELKKVILKGRDMFINTQQFRGEYVFNDLSCSSCHLGEGKLNWSGPVWPAVTTLPDFRGKNQHVNSLEERIAGCFSFSMNGTPPEYGSDDMLALAAYHQWVATNAPVYERNIGGRGFGHLGREMPADISYEKGQVVYEANCAICHGEDGAGQKKDGQVVFPPLWGDGSYNWGAGMVRVYTAASFIKNNMPLGKPGSLSDADAWNVALYINSQERPQDPRYTGDAKETREKYLNFHKYSMYGTERDGRTLGQHDNTGSKPFLKPAALKPRTFE